MSNNTTRSEWRAAGLQRIFDSGNVKRMERYLQSQGFDTQYMPQPYIVSLMFAEIENERLKRHMNNLKKLKANNKNMLATMGST